MRTADAEALFDRSAATYDAVNTVISLGLDRRWRRWVAEKAVRDPGDTALDLMCGAGEVAVEAARLGAQVTAVDVSSAMLAEARHRASAAGVELEALRADVTEPDSLPPGPFDAVTLSLGLRYLDDPVALLRAAAGRLAIAGRVVILEFCVPPSGLVADLASLYFFRVLPRIASALSGRRELYDVLGESTQAIGSAEDVARLVRAAGLAVVERRSFGFGLVTGLVAVSDGNPRGAVGYTADE